MDCIVHGVAKSQTQLSNFHSLTLSASGKESACQCRRRKKHEFDTWVRKILWRRKWQPTPVFLPGELHGQRSLVSYSSLGLKELDTTEPALTHTYTHTHA